MPVNPSVEPRAAPSAVTVLRSCFLLLGIPSNLLLLVEGGQAAEALGVRPLSAGSRSPSSLCCWKEAIPLLLESTTATAHSRCERNIAERITAKGAHLKRGLRQEELEGI